MERTYRLKSEEELIDLIDSYYPILNEEMMEYLYSVLRLEESIVKSSIDENAKKCLSELDMFKDLGIYNISTLIRNLYDEKDFSYFGVNQGYEGIRVAKNSIPLINFDYSLPKRSELFSIPRRVSEHTYGLITCHKWVRGEDRTRSISKLEEERLDLSNAWYQKNLDMLGLEETDFEVSSSVALTKENNYLTKTLIYRTPGLEVKSKIKYI